MNFCFNLIFLIEVLNSLLLKDFEYILNKSVACDELVIDSRMYIYEISKTNDTYLLHLFERDVLYIYFSVYTISFGKFNSEIICNS